MINRTLTAISLILLFTTSLNAQSFVTPIKSLTGQTEVLTQDGQVIQGKIVAAMTGMRGMTSLTVKDEKGKRHKFKADDIIRMKVKINGLAKLEIIDHNTQNLEQLFMADFDEIIDRKYVYFEQLTIPGKKKSYLVQLLNPGFHRKIKVFEKPSAQSGETTVGGVAVSGGQATAYYVLKGNNFTEVKKMKYKKSQFRTLFADCPELLSFYTKPDFRDFAQHILYYDRHCK